MEKALKFFFTSHPTQTITKLESIPLNNLVSVIDFLLLQSDFLPNQTEKTNNLRSNRKNLKVTSFSFKLLLDLNNGCRLFWGLIGHYRFIKATKRAFEAGGENDGGGGCWKRLWRGRTSRPHDLFINAAAAVFMVRSESDGKFKRVEGTSRSSRDLNLTRRHQKDPDSHCANNTKREQMPL